MRDIQKSIRDFLASEEGFAGAEKALLLVVALGVILAVSAVVKASSMKATRRIDRLMRKG